MATGNPSAMLAESLSTFSKAAYQAFAEVEAQSRGEVARMAADVREAKADRDRATRELHAFQLEAQGWKQEIVATKATLCQAELTIAHQAETLAAQVETIAQLRREVTQWKDQSRNWQEHFLRVEQERCAQSSRIDELVVEKLQYPHQRIASTSLHTPKSMKYTNGTNSAPSSSKRPLETTSPTQPPAPPSPSTLDSSAIAPSTQLVTNTQKRNKRAVKTQNERERDIPFTQPHTDQEEGSSTGAKRPRKNPTNTSNTQAPATTSAHQKVETPAVRSSTVIRRVRAVVHVKREESYSDEESLHEVSGAASTSQNTASSIANVKKKEESAEYQRYLRTPRRKIIVDEEQDNKDEDEDEAEIRNQVVDSGSDPLSDSGHRRSGGQRGRFRQRSHINYREEDDDEEEDEEEDDELMMGAEENHDEVYGTQRIETHDTPKSKRHSGPPAKKRKVAAR